MTWRLLVVEDDPDGQEVVARMLRHHHPVLEKGEVMVEGQDIQRQHTEGEQPWQPR